MIKFALALLVLLATATAAAAQQRTACRTAPDQAVAPLPWAWRMVDGRQCWYPGERRRDKSLLYWARESAAPVSVPAAITAAADPAPPPSAPEPEPEQPPPLSEEDQKLLESYWPDLATLLAERSPTHLEMFEATLATPPRPSGRDDPLALMVLALIVVSTLALGLERYSKRKRLKQPDRTVRPPVNVMLEGQDDYPLPSFLLRGPRQDFQEPATTERPSYFRSSASAGDKHRG